MNRDEVLASQIVPQSLRALSADSPDAADAAEHWLDRADLALERWTALRAASSPEPGDASAGLAAAGWDVLAAWGALVRLRAELQGEFAGLREALRAVAEREVAPIGAEVLGVMDTSAWRGALVELADQVGEGLYEPSDVASRASDLLEDLDDAFLVLWALQKLRSEDLDLDGPLGALLGAAEQLREEPEAVLEAQVFMRACAGALDPAAAFDGRDMGLCFDPWVIAGDLLVDAEEESEPVRLSAAQRAFWQSAEEAPLQAPSNVTDLLRTRLERAVRALSARVGEAVTALAPPPQPVLAAARRGLADEWTRTWEGVGGEYLARLRLARARETGDEALVRLTVERARAGDRALLYGLVVPLSVDATGVGSGELFLGALREASGSPVPVSFCLLRGPDEAPEVLVGLARDLAGAGE